MKLLGFCLLVALVCCGSMVRSASNSSRPIQRLKLQEAFRQLNVVRQRLLHSKKMVRTPPKHMEDCCSLSALRCFRENFHLEFKITERSHKLFYKSLNNNYTELGLDFCDSPSSNTTCLDCHEHPKESAKEFFKRLEFLFQRGISRLSIS